MGAENEPHAKLQEIKDILEPLIERVESTSKDIEKTLEDTADKE